MKGLLRYVTLVLSLVLLLVGQGCDQKGAPEAGAQKAQSQVSSSVECLVVIDRTEPAGHWSGAKETYETATRRFVSNLATVQGEDTITYLTVFDFTAVLAIATEAKDTLPENLVPTVIDQINRGSFNPDLPDARGTYFVKLVQELDKRSKAARGDIYVLVLTDGHYDDELKDLKAAVTKLGKIEGLKCLMILPVETDTVLPNQKKVTRHWRRDLSETLAPLGPVKVQNRADYQSAIAEMFATGGN
jgi:hypothetical protein